MHIGFDDEECWEVKWITSSRFFMRALRRLMPVESIVYLESYSECSEFLSFIEKHRCEPKLVEPVREASSNPPTWTEHLTFGEPLINSIEEFFAQWNFPYAHHVHGYHQGRLIFWFHDAFRGGDLQVSPQYSEKQIAQFCGDLAPKFQRKIRRADPSGA